MRKPYIAIVDDDASFAAYLRTFLSLRGYEARCYARGDELLASMKQNEAPDAILLDVMMPGLDGLATLRALKTSQPGAQVIMLSGRNQASTIVEAVRLGAADYVVKPDDPEGLGEIALDVAIKNAIEKNRLVSELSELRQQLSDDEDRAVWGNSEKMRNIATVIEQVADSDVTVLIRGESGVGKELVSRAIHQRSTRRSRPFVKVNCAALPAELLESELFGHERGAFTGAATTRIGKFEQADTGTLMMDEIGEMKPALQAKLLHVLQDAEFTKLGSNKRIQVDVRIVAATNRDLEVMLMNGEFREDLYYRLKVIELTVPALRERPDEVPTLTDFFVTRYSRKYNRPLKPISDQLRQLFLQYEWPGNIRELENMIKRVVILQDEHLVIREIERNMQRSAAVAVAAAAPAYAAAGAAVGVGVGGGPTSLPLHPLGNQPEAADLGETPDAPPDESGGSLAAVAKAAAIKAERAAIEQTLRQVHWNRRKAAQILGVSYKTLLNKIKECGISRA
ncbi:MAG TPA: sigma-54 dependent transcriptional regulator [Vicinamibacterales bacterium]|jgi:two-component system response regulator AtoC|nr:sigma-54 dependent transcriptional regulator [Vicinamibacterales bacterium]